MSPTLKKSLISLATFTVVTVVGYLSNNLSSFGLPAQYLPLAAAGLAILMHWLPTPATMAGQTQVLPTSAQK